ncbi:MAG: uroporphyrinogen-III synthase [Pseudomonadota bacterium]
MRIWVTRPRDDAAAFADALKAQGHEAVVAPLFAPRSLVDTVTSDQLTAAAPTRIIVTSRNALRALADAGLCTRLRNVPVLAVGPGTAAMARTLGFQSVETGVGTATDLISHVTYADPNQNGRYLFLRGQHVTVDVGAELAACGYTATSVTLYDMQPDAAAPSFLLKALTDNALDAVALFSPNAAQRYVHLVAANGLEIAGQKLVHYVLSDRIAAELAPLQPDRIAVAAQPNAEAMLALIGGRSAHSVH